MKIGITGANGHVGGNLVRRLLKDDHSIKVLQYRDHEALDGLDLIKVNGDINNIESLDEFCAGLDVVYHLAAKISIGYNSYDSLYKTNVAGTQNIVTAAKKAGVKRFIHFSSIHALTHAPLDKPMDETNPIVTDSPLAYEKTKSVAQRWVQEQQSANFDVIVLNPTSIVGPYDFKPSLMGQFIINLYNGSLPALVPGGYNWVDVRDIAEAAANALYQGKGGESYILSGHYKTVVGLADSLNHLTTRNIKRPVFPLWMAKLGVPFIKVWSKARGEQPLYTMQSLDILQSGNKNIRNDKARKELGYHPRPMVDTLKDTLQWLKDNQYIKE